MSKMEPALLSFSKEKVKESEIALKEFDFLRFTMLDMNGIPRGKVLPSEEAVKFLRTGVGCSSFLQTIGPNDEIIMPGGERKSAKMIPDLNTLHSVPWIGNNKYRTGELIAETFWDPGRPQEACSRNIARRQLRRLDEMGLGLYSGVELEFILLNDETKERLFSDAGYQSMYVHSEFDSWFSDVYQNIKEAGVSIQVMHAEYSPGQFEFTTVPQFGIEAADACVILKQGIKDMAKQRGWQANFMAQLDTQTIGSAGQFSFSVLDKNKMENTFWDASTSDTISKTGQYWIGGLIKHANALTALSCITTNCYQRLHKRFMPHKANWALNDKSCMLRVNLDGPKGTYIENRLPSALFNPYLLMAATIAAGIDGVVNKLACPEPCDFTEEAILPHSLEEALDCLKQDKVMVDALGETFVKWFIQSKTEADLKAIQSVTEETERLKSEIKRYSKLM